MLTDFDRRSIIVPLTVCAQDFLAARTETAAEALTTFIVPWNGVIRGIQTGVAVFTGTTKTWIVTIANSTPVTIVTAATQTDSPLAVRTSGLAVPVSAGQILTVNHAFGHTDCVIEGGLVIVEFQCVADAPSN